MVSLSQTMLLWWCANLASTVCCVCPPLSSCLVTRIHADILIVPCGTCHRRYGLRGAGCDKSGNATSWNIARVKGCDARRYFGELGSVGSKSVGYGDEFEGSVIAASDSSRLKMKNGVSSITRREIQAIGCVSWASEWMTTEP